MTARSFVHEGVRHITVSNLGGGSVVVEPGPREEAVEGTFSSSNEDTLESIVIRQDREQLRFEVPNRLFRSADVHLRLGVPPGLDYTISTGSADVQIGVEADRTRVNSGSGDIGLDVVHDLVCSSGSGNITIAEIRGEAAKVNTGSGEIMIYEARCPLVAKSGSGSLMIKTLHQAPLQAKSGSGEISVAATTGSVDLRSASGSITVGVAENLPTWLDLHSLSGQIRIALEASGEPERGEPYVTVRARTASGEIAVYRA